MQRSHDLGCWSWGPLGCRVPGTQPLLWACHPHQVWLQPLEVTADLQLCTQSHFWRGGQELGAAWGCSASKPPWELGGCWHAEPPLEIRSGTPTLPSHPCLLLLDAKSLWGPIASNGAAQRGISGEGCWLGEHPTAPEQTALPNGECKACNRHFGRQKQNYSG